MASALVVLFPILMLVRDSRCTQSQARRRSFNDLDDAFFAMMQTPQWGFCKQRGGKTDVARAHNTTLSM